jgi:hypothetical protein
MSWVNNWIGLEFRLVHGKGNTRSGSAAEKVKFEGKNKEAGRRATEERIYEDKAKEDRKRRQGREKATIKKNGERRR